MQSSLERAFRLKVETMQKKKAEEEKEARTLQGILESEDLVIEKWLFKQLLEEQIRPEIRHIFYSEVKWHDFYADFFANCELENKEGVQCVQLDKVAKVLEKIDLNIILSVR